MQKKVVISCGPIPAMLDSVKFITNRFKGGLAFKTAHSLKEKFEVTIVKWKFTELPENMQEGFNIVNIIDVFDYFNWMEQNAVNYDAFIMAAAVANLTPSNPYKDKFPSHMYKEGEKFDIQFEIASRAIDIIKKKNPRAFLVGYKLFDSPNDEELIKVAKHTLKDSKANIIFANTPQTAKMKKIALMQDGANIKMSFDEHIEMLIDLINQEFFKTVILNKEDLKINSNLTNKIELAKEIVKKFETTIDDFGTIAIKIDEKSFVTTSRGHRGDPVFVYNIDPENRVVYADNKATLNAPALFAMLKKYDYVIHRHDTDKQGVLIEKYTFPGTKNEYNTISEMLDNLKNDTIIENYHGYLKGYNFKEINWNNYYKDFPERYFAENPEILALLEKYKGKETLEIGGNKNADTKYVLDKFVKVPNAINITLDDLDEMKFDLIVIRNAINYIPEEDLLKIKNALKHGGEFIANSFNSSPDFRLRENEGIYVSNNEVNHFLIKNEENVIYHKFYNRSAKDYEKLGFKTKQYGKNSILVCL